jgi:hypothetical protein
VSSAEVTEDTEQDQRPELVEGRRRGKCSNDRVSALWQILVLVFVIVVYANLFGQYGIYHQPMVDVVAAVVGHAFAAVAGTVIPLRRWRSTDNINSREADTNRS